MARKRGGKRAKLKMVRGAVHSLGKKGRGKRGRKRGGHKRGRRK